MAGHEGGMAGHERGVAGHERWAWLDMRGVWLVIYQFVLLLCCQLSIVKLRLFIIKPPLHY